MLVVVDILQQPVKIVQVEMEPGAMEIVNGIQIWMNAKQKELKV